MTNNALSGMMQIIVSGKMKNIPNGQAKNIKNGKTVNMISGLMNTIMNIRLVRSKGDFTATGYLTVIIFVKN
jgi:hypothetical protein